MSNDLPLKHHGIHCMPLGAGASILTESMREASPDGLTVQAPLWMRRSRQVDCRKAEAASTYLQL